MLRTYVAFLLSVLLLPSVALAEKRVALVVGNSAYQSTPALTNPRNDANDISAALKALGFQVVEGFDLDKATFDRKIRDFATALDGAAAGVFFYAGHGLQVAGQNYLVPVDAQLTTAAALEFEMVRADVVHRVMESQTNTNVLFLDACRDNPLARNLARAIGTRSSEIGRGLAAVESGVGTLISFSTQPGSVALDGTGRNSPFARALIKHMSSATDDLSAILISVRNDVMTETQRKQVPWEHSALTGRFYFGSTGQTEQPTRVAPDRLSDAAQAWDRTRDQPDMALLEEFAVQYKETFYAHLARARINELKKHPTEIASTTPASSLPPSPSRAPPFDGVWLLKKVCSQLTDGTRGYAVEFVVEVKGGVIHGEAGVKDKPGWNTFDGKIQPDGSAWIKERAVNAERVGQSPRGTPWAFDIFAQFDATRGTGKRVSGRQCDFTFAKKQVVAPTPSVPGPMETAAKKGPFDGTWTVSGVAAESPQCHARWKYWTHAIRIDGTTVFAGDGTKGTISAKGEFEYTFQPQGALRGRYTGRVLWRIRERQIHACCLFWFTSAEGRRTPVVMRTAWSGGRAVDLLWCQLGWQSSARDHSCYRQYAHFGAALARAPRCEIMRYSDPASLSRLHCSPTPMR